ncbi:MAG: aminopeptidase N C-terminal domain-containing protein [Hyphomicrobiales bacterium]
MAARLATVFNTWRRYDDERRQLIRAELKGILEQAELSNDVEEIVTKVLT